MLAPSPNSHHMLLAGAGSERLQNATPQLPRESMGMRRKRKQSSQVARDAMDLELNKNVASGALTSAARLARL